MTGRLGVERDGGGTSVFTAKEVFDRLVITRSESELNAHFCSERSSRVRGGRMSDYMT